MIILNSFLELVVYSKLGAQHRNMTSSKDEPDPEAPNGEVSPRSAPDQIPLVIINEENGPQQEENEEKKSAHKDDDNKVQDGTRKSGAFHGSVLGISYQNGTTQRGHEDDVNDYMSEYGSEYGHNLLPGGDYQSTFSINDLPSNFSNLFTFF